jgi:S-adenosylmethionine:tRNA ribosyltransferase-isomerase
MRTELLNYDLPEDLIAQEPALKRSQSKLLVMERSTGRVYDRRFENIIEYLKAGDCLVLNNTRVLPAKFFGRRTTGAELEALFLRENETNSWEVMLKNARKVKAGETIVFYDKEKKDFCRAKAAERMADGHWILKIESNQNSQDILEKIGSAPLPPYIKRSNDKDTARMDLQRYQTVYAEQPGAVAAPTAGLHFTGELLKQIKSMGIEVAYVTLHVGAGTFKPVTIEILQDHQMHSERFSIEREDADIINTTINNGGRIIAAGTTSVRTLETVAQDRRVTACEGSTKLFILPGYEFKVVDAMLTNFHLPKSTLLALVGAFAGLDNVLTAYRHAIEKRYRFYSYGDAMLIV